MKCVVMFFLCCFSFQWAVGQKKLERQWGASQIEKVVIQGNGFSEISFQSTEEQLISASVTVEGEYFENILLQTKIAHQTLYFSENFTPFFTPENDKLAAHKVMAVKLVVYIPKNIAVTCSSDSANIKASGAFKTLLLQIENGHCTLTKVFAKGRVATKRGNITLYSPSVVNTSCYSKYGEVTGCELKKKNPALIVESVYGNITHIQTE